MEQKTVHVLQNRENRIIMHWFSYAIAGLMDIQPPAYFFTLVNESFHYETLALLASVYQFAAPTENDIVINHHGADIFDLYYLKKPYYSFVRELFLTKSGLELKSDPVRLIYISRNKVDTIKWRQDANYTNGSSRKNMSETELLDKLGFECIYLEDYPLVDKIKLFQEAKVIVAPYGGALTMCYFANKKTQVIEIRNDEWAQYRGICENLGISILTYTKITNLPGELNFTIDDVDDLVRIVNGVCA